MPMTVAMGLGVGIAECVNRGAWCWLLSRHHIGPTDDDKAPPEADAGGLHSWRTDDQLSGSIRSKSTDDEGICMAGVELSLVSHGRALQMPIRPTVGIMDDAAARQVCIARRHG